MKDLKQYSDAKRGNEQINTHATGMNLQLCKKTICILYANVNRSYSSESIFS